MSRIARRFDDLRRQGRAAFIPFITAGDPDSESSFAVLERLPAAGADLIELGMPFSDPMADGPAIQASSLRSLNAGTTLPKVLALVRQFREMDNDTPVVLMGYFNSIHAYGVAAFARDAASSGVDGLIVVDVPPEEDEVLRGPAVENNIDVVRLATPTTGEQRLATILNGASGFLYYVSVAGVTGTKTYAEDEVRRAIARLKAHSHIPCAVGFGIRAPEQARRIAEIADGIVVGSAIVEKIAQAAAQGKPRADMVEEVIGFCSALAQSVHAARPAAVVR